MPRLEEQFERFRSQGDVAALGRVFDELGPRMQRLARHLARDRTEAEDLVQATFLTAIEKKHAFDATRRLEAWLTGILVHHASLARRARARVIEPDRLDSRVSQDPLDVAGAREMSEALAVALARLGPSDREVLLPLLMDGRRAVEIARELGRRPDTIHMRIHRGLARLRRLLPANFAIGALIQPGRARGLGEVRVEILRQAQVQLAGGGSVGLATTAAAWGIVMTTKQWWLAATAAAFALCAGVFFFVPAGESAPPASESSREAELATASHAAPPGPIARMPAEPASMGSHRSQVQSFAASVQPDAFELLVLRAEREPAVGATVALVGPTGDVTAAKADENGVCKFDGSRQSMDAYVRDDARLPWHTRVDVSGEGPHTIELPAGCGVSGRIYMSDGQPLAPIELQLSSDIAPEGLAGAPMGVFEALDLLEYGAKKVFARTSPASGGRFRFVGLPAGWSGSLMLPKELVFVVDGQATKSSSMVFETARAGNDLPIAYRPRIIGRLLDSASLEPIADVTANILLEYSDGNTTMMGFQTDCAGRFTIVLDYRTDAVGLRLPGIRTIQGSIARAPDLPRWSGPCEPRDLGDILCTLEESRPVEFHVLDTQGVPIAGARGGIARLDFVTTDAHGIGRFPAVPLDADQLRVVAPGHAIVRILLDSETVSPIRVVLPPTNRLTIALPPEAAGRREFQLALISTPLLFGGTSRMYDHYLRGGMVGWCFSADGDKGTREGAVQLRFSDEGRIEVEDVQTGVPFRVQLLGRSSDSPEAGGVLAEVRIASLGPTEQRTIQLSMEDLAGHVMRTLRGQAVDELGQPILGAGISRCFACGSRSAISQLDGSFELDVANQDRMDVEVSKRGYVPFRVRDWSLVDGAPLLARLVRGHDLRLEIVDTAGRSVDHTYVAAEIEGFGPPGVIEQVSPGVFLLADLPAGDVDVYVGVGGKDYTSTHRSDAGAARVTVAEHGRLEVAWSFSGLEEDSRSYRIALRPVGSDNVPQVSWTPWPGRVQSFTFQNVLPGQYTIGLEVGRETTEEGQESSYSPLHEPAHVTIVGGETRKIEL